MALEPVKRSWLCGEFRSTFERNNTQCKADIATFFEDLGEPIPSSKHNINQKKTERHIQKWFNYYCGEATFDFEAEQRVFQQRREKTKEEKEAQREKRRQRLEKEGRQDANFVNQCKLKKEQEKAERKAARQAARENNGNAAAQRSHSQVTSRVLSQMTENMNIKQLAQAKSDKSNKSVSNGSELSDSESVKSASVKSASVKSASVKSTSQKSTS